MRNCTNCQYAVKKPQLEGGGLECRRNPPQASVLMSNQGMAIVSAFPPVTDKMLCSDYSNHPFSESEKNHENHH